MILRVMYGPKPVPFKLTHYPRSGPIPFRARRAPCSTTLPRLGRSLDSSVNRSLDSFPTRGCSVNFVRKNLARRVTGDKNANQ